MNWEKKYESRFLSNLQNLYKYNYTEKNLLRISYEVLLQIL